MVKKRIDRVLYDQDTGEIETDVLKEKAYPELRQKYNIFVAWEQLEQSEEKMMYDRNLSNRVMPNNQYDFERKLVKLFNYMREMIRFKIDELSGIKSEDTSQRAASHRALFRKLLLLERGISHFNLNTLFDLKDFVIVYMHECNLSNLLRHEEDDLDAFEKEYL